MQEFSFLKFISRTNSAEEIRGST